MYRGSRKQSFRIAAEQVDPTPARSHGRDTAAESCAAGAGPAATADGGDQAAASAEAAAETAAVADTTAAPGGPTVRQQQDREAVTATAMERQRVR